MSVHARSDVSAVTISPAHGGCGDVHSRPVVNGAPAKLWTLTCVQCEDHLRNDPHWSGTISGIPETPDEKQYREDQEVKGKLDQQNQTAEALAKLSGLGDLPAMLAKLAEAFSNGEPRREPDSSVSCPKCSTSSKSDAKFCGNCGHKFEAAPVAAHLPDLTSLTDDQLRLVAQEKGIKVHPRTGRAKLLEALGA